MCKILGISRNSYNNQVNRHTSDYHIRKTTEEVSQFTTDKKLEQLAHVLEVLFG